MIQSKKIIEDYTKAYESAQVELDRLSEEAETFRESLEGQRDARQRIKTAQAKIDALQEKREDLFSQHQRASFAGDTEKLEEIAKERKDIESRIEIEASQIEEARLDLVANAIDGVASAQWQLSLSSVPKFHPNDLLGRITQALYAEENALEEKRIVVGREMKDVPYNKAHYEQNDPVTQRLRKQEQEQAQAKKRAEEARERARVDGLVDYLRTHRGALEAYENGRLAGHGRPDPAVLARV
jgi:hypothetical protein